AAFEASLVDFDPACSERLDVLTVTLRLVCVPMCNRGEVLHSDEMFIGAQHEFRNGSEVEPFQFRPAELFDGVIQIEAIDVALHSRYLLSFQVCAVYCRPFTRRVLRTDGMKGLALRGWPFRVFGTGDFHLWSSRCMCEQRPQVTSFRVSLS